MKKIILIAIVLITITNAKAQKVYSVNSEYKADVKVYLVQIISRPFSV